MTVHASIRLREWMDIVSMDEIGAYHCVLRAILENVYIG